MVWYIYVMKKLVIFVFGVLVAFSSSSALAASDLYTPSLLPGTPFYFLKNWKESVELFFTLNPEKKAEVLSTQAGRRLAETYALLAKNMPNTARENLPRYEEAYTKAFTAINNIKNDAARTTVLENLSNNTGLEMRMLAKIHDSAPEALKKDLSEMLGTVSKTQTEIVKVTPLTVRKGILKKIEDNRSEVISQSSGSAKVLIPSKILVKD